MILKVQYKNHRKYIKIGEASFEVFITEVKEKFSIPLDTLLKVTDETGTEVDQDVFADLTTSKDICFIIENECDSSYSNLSSPSLTDTISMSSSSKESDSDGFNPFKRIRREEALQDSAAKDLIKEILLSKPGGTAVLKEYEDTGTICDSSRRQMVNILAAHMTETEGRIPQRITKEKYALGIISLFPSLKDPLSPKGYEHFYDSQSGSGFLAWRLKTIQRKTKLAVNSDAPKTGTTGGPTLGRTISHLDNQPPEESCKEAVALMNHTSDKGTILLKMRETFEYRQRLVHNPETASTVLSVFPRLLDTKGLILQDFSLLFGPETAARLLEKWPSSYKAKVIKEAEALTSTPFLQRLLKSARDQQGQLSSDDPAEWDSDMASLLLLLHILPPQSPGRKKAQKISVRQATDHLVMFHKVCQIFSPHLF
ncbi:hypothetical protein AMEX_G16206 [Astyanax mexicanus]|uniref:Uncharacterized protein n=1 Tax=Astyanax mexicanus TaxID=7994 RepID=A0A8T2LBX7_ASTMX|nr:hypothetical protein AMEX_G26417 [Astyanax mexicanus]KAG9269203.1 hypothetical protein AMEX_G16206 [Astyanax mexicanus]